MINLVDTNDSLELVLAAVVVTTQAAISVHYTEHYLDSVTNIVENFLPDKQNSVSNNTTPVTILSAPAANQRRSVRYISVRNNDTAAITVTIRYNDNTVLTNIIVVTLFTGDVLEFVDTIGFRVITSSGAVKTIQASTVTNTYFEASLTVTQTPITASTFTTIIYNNEIIDTANAYNPATGIWTVPETGKYSITAFAHEAGFADGANVVISVFVAGVETMRIGEQLPSNPTGNINAGCQVGSSIIMRLTAGQLVTIRGLIGAAAGGATLRFTGTAGGELTYFRAMRVE